MKLQEKMQMDGIIFACVLEKSVVTGRRIRVVNVTNTMTFYGFPVIIYLFPGTCFLVHL